MCTTVIDDHLMLWLILLIPPLPKVSCKLPWRNESETMIRIVTISQETEAGTLSLQDLRHR